MLDIVFDNTNLRFLCCKWLVSSQNVRIKNFTHTHTHTHTHARSPPLVAGAAANRLQDCCFRLSVSARTCSGVPVCWSTEHHQEPAVETATTVMVVGYVSRPYVAPVHCRRPRFPDCRCTSLEHSVAGRSFIQRQLKTELFSRRFPDWCNRVNFRYICKVASQLWLMPL